MVPGAVGSVKGTKRTQKRMRVQKKRRPQKRRRPQKKGMLQHGSSHRSHSRTSVAKKRMTSPQPKHHPMKRKRKASKHPLRFNTKKLKGSKGSGQFLSREAKGLIITFMEDIYKQVSSEAERLRKESREAMVSPVHVRAALLSVVPKRRWKKVAFGNGR